jgi:ABC-type Fe3+-hydroxamate transport system substrate-binding protein
MATKSFSDQMGEPISLPHPHHRIISLVPSQTELLADLDLDENVLGITKFCVHPSDWLKRKIIVGGTKKFHFDIIGKIKPDLILGNKEENYREGILILRKKYPVWMSDITTLQDALSMITSIGQLTDKLREANQIAQNINDKFNTLKRYKDQSVLYLIWRQPWMAAGIKTFIHSLLTTIGLKNAIDFKERYPELSTEEIKDLRPDYIFLSSEPFPFKQNHIEELHRISPASKILLVDGEMFSWYGSRLLYAADYFNTLALG